MIKPLITAGYASLLALLVVWLSFRVIKIRWATKISLGDGRNPKLRAAIRAHGNATEYVPLSLILLALLELDGANWVLVHGGGLAVLTSRLLHAKGMLSEQLRFRVLGMQMTIYTLIGLALANLGYAASRLF